MPAASLTRLLRGAIPLLMFCGFASAQDNGLRQSGIAVEATAADAVQARDRALAGGRRAALNRLAAAVGAPAPSMSDGQIEGMVASMQIEEERVSSTRYSGRITVVFRGSVRNVLGGAAVSADPSAPGSGGGGTASASPGSAASSYVDAQTSFGSLAQWLDLRRRLLGSGPVASIDILAISTDGARLRLGLRAPVETAAGAIAANGVVLSPGPAGEPWQVGLGGG